MSEPIITTTAGKIRGALEDSVYILKGAPYGWSAAGEHRFLPARPPVPWIAFARSGDPNHPSIPSWTPYTQADRDTMIFDVPCRMEKESAREERKAWDGMDIIV